uniref:Ubiquitin-like protease family profile domain-containing protein n=1 Tax=Anopheles quadriannulatus TaxID=34691 RepID=A0A182XGR1_ANOQN
MKMFPETLISRLKQLLTGGGGSGGSTDGNDRKRKSVALLDVDAKKRRMTTLSSIPAPVEESIVGNHHHHQHNSSSGNNSSSRPLLQQNGAHGGLSNTMANARRLSEITDMPPVNHQHVPYVPTLGLVQRNTLPGVVGSSRSSIIGTGGGSSSNTNRSNTVLNDRFGASALRPLGRRNNNGPPPSLIPIKYATARPSIGSQGNGGTSRPFAGGLFRQQQQHIPAAVPRPTEPGNVSLLATDFSNLLRSKNSVTPSTGSDGTAAALDRDLSVQREVRRKYEALMQKFIPIANNPPPLGAYERYTRKPINGDAVQRPEAAEAEKKHGAPLELTDDEEEHVQDVSDASDDCVEVTSKSAGRLFTTIDPHQLSAAQEREEEEQSAAAAAALLPEPVNSVRARFETKHVFRDDIIQDVQARYGSLFSQRKSLIEQERHRLGSLRQCTQQQETEARNKLHHYVCSFYKFDVLDESELKEGTPEPEVVPLPELTREQLDEMQRKLRTGHQVVMEKFNLRITGNDLVTLQDMNWLNDAVINFYMELLRERGEQKRDQGLPKVYTMNTFFLPQLLKMGYAGVRRWTRKVDLLAHDMIVVPVHVGGIHWCMATIDLRHKTIHYYDSMGSPNNAVLNALEQYLCEESLDKRKAPFDKTGLTKQNMRDCPRQKNGSDCGVFSCMFAEFLSRDHPITFDQSNMPYFRKKMTIEIMLGKLLT